MDGLSPEIVEYGGSLWAVSQLSASAAGQLATAN